MNGPTTLDYAENGSGQVATYTISGSSGVTWSLLAGGDSTSFSIDADGNLNFNNPPDYEAPTDENRDNVYEITVQGDDGSAEPSTLNVSVNVTGVNEFAPVIKGPTTILHPESNSGLAIANYTVSDPDAGDIISFVSLRNINDGSKFTINPYGLGTSIVTFELNFKNLKLDFENPSDDGKDNVYELIIMAADSSFPSDNQEGVVNNLKITLLPISVSVTDVNEPPKFDDGLNTTISINENVPAGTPVGIALAATDPDTKEPLYSSLSYSLSGIDASSFDIDASTGQITVASGTTLDYETKSSYTITAEVTDSKGDDGGDDNSIDDTIDLSINVNDVSVDLSVEPTSVAEDDGPTTVTVTATLDGGTSFHTDQTVTVRVGKSSDTATEGSDYVSVDDFTITIPAGTASGSGSFSFAPLDDVIDEAVAERLSVGGTGPLTASGTTLLLVDDDATPMLTLLLDNTAISENGGVATVTAGLSWPSSAAVTLTVAAVPVSPAVAADFTLSENTTLSLPAGETTSSGMATITAVDNGVEAADKTVTVSASVSGGHGVAAPEATTLTLSNDDVPPAAITGLRATRAGATTFWLGWHNPRDDSITAYHISKDGGATFSSFSCCFIGINASNLDSVTTYTFAVRAVNPFGNGPWAKVTGTTGLPAPTGLTASAGDGEVTLSWDDPGNAFITGYKVSSNGYYSFTPISGSNASTTSHTVTGLTNGTTYKFALRAVQGSVTGSSSWVNATPLVLPATPRGLSATPGNSQVTLNWEDPDNDSISGYELSTDGGITFSAISGSNAGTTSHTVTGLRSGTQYIFVVRAVNGASQGASASVTAMPLWPAPTNLVAAPDNKRIVLQWDTGSSGIVKYLVRATLLNASSAVSQVLVSPGSGSKTTTSMSSLTNGTSYSFSVQAVDDSENPGSIDDSRIAGAASSVTATPALALLAAPTNISTTVSTTQDGPQVTLRWDDPGNITIRKYQYSSDGGVTFNHMNRSNRSTTSFTFNNLNYGREYTLAVRASNRSGESEAASVTVTPQAPAPTNLVAAPDNKRIALQWDTGDSAIVSYLVRARLVSDGSTVSQMLISPGTGTKRTTSMSSLTNGTEYSFSVQAVDDSENPGSIDDIRIVGAASSVSATPALALPAAPTNLSATVSTTQNGPWVRLSWDDPANISIRKYQYSSDGGTTFNHMNGSNHSTTSFTFKNLSYGSEYTLAVRASNRSGESAAASVTVTPQASASSTLMAASDNGQVVSAVPSAPSGLTATPGNKDIALRWDDPGDDSITGYEVNINGGTNFTLISGSDASTTSHTVTGLKNGTTYTMALRAVNVMGAGEAAMVEATTLDPAQQRLNRVHETLLPQLAQTMTASTLSAIRDRLDAVASGAPAEGSINLVGQSSLDGILMSNGQALEDGTFNLRQAAGRSSFGLSVKHGANSSSDNIDFDNVGDVGVWGSGDYRELSSDDDSAVDWNGDMLGFHLGADLWMQPNLLAGLSASRQQGSFLYSDTTASEATGGRYESYITSVQPYINWTSPGGVDLWSTLGYGQGEIVVVDDLAGRESSDTSMTMAALGISNALLSRDGLIAAGTTTLKLKGEGSVTRVESEGSGLINQLSVDVRQVRLSLEGSHEHQLKSGGKLIPALELGLRHDSGDGLSGFGMELGGQLRYLQPAHGLTIALAGRRLMAHREDTQEWGVAGLISLDPGEDKRGLSLSIAPSKGKTTSGMQGLWDRSITSTVTEDQPSVTRLDTELGYNYAGFDGQGMINPYVGLLLGDDDSRSYRAGLNMEITSSMELRLEGSRKEQASDTPDHGIILQSRWLW